MNIHTSSIEMFLDAILANSAKRSGGESIAEVIHDGLHVFREFPNNNGVMLFLVDDNEFNFRFSAALPNENNNNAQEIFNVLAQKGSIGSVLSAGKAQYISDEINDLSGFIIIPLSVPSAAVGLVILAADLHNDDMVLLRLCEMSAYQFAYALNNTRLLQRLTYNQIVLEQKVSARTIHLEQIQRELKTILDCVQTGILIINAESGVIASANPAAELQELIMKLTTEITERERAEEAARQALIKEKELADLKSNFVSMVSHEFRTPLTTILSYTQIMQNYREKLTEDDQIKYLKNIELAVSRMTSMLNDILFIGKSNSGALTVTMRVINLFELCSSILDEMRVLDAEKHKIIFKFDYPPSAVRTDEKLLRQILLNLLTNALKYSQSSTEVELAVSHSETAVIIEVKDKGIGIPKEYFSNLFESFRRADNVGNISGTGLGLSIVKQSVDLLGGNIKVESIENEGSVFTVELPIS
ncbi:MAG: HAMP domain-containing histidine kinase [Ignavibacteriae bacterium]|nr:HAMP domain-containing histidine kinase [Ignavibacteriota bacterium]